MSMRSSSPSPSASVILSSVDERILKQLGVNYTCEPTYEKTKLYHA